MRLSHLPSFSTLLLFACGLVMVVIAHLILSSTSYDPHQTDIGLLMWVSAWLTVFLAVHWWRMDLREHRRELAYLSDYCSRLEV